MATREELEILLKAKNDTPAAFQAFQKDLSTTKKAAEDHSKALAKSSLSAKGFADSLGKVSTTLARSADLFGLPAGALRSLDDAADVAEIGMGGLTKTMGGFNAATLGVVGAGLALGAAIGGWLNGFKAVRDFADRATGGLYDLLAAVGIFETKAGAFDKGFSPAQMAAIKASQDRVNAAVIEGVKADKAKGLALGELKEKYKNASAAVQNFIDYGIKKEEDAQKKAVETTKKAAADLSAALDFQEKVTQGVAASFEYFAEQERKAADDALKLAETQRTLKAELSAATIEQIKQTHSLRELSLVIDPATGLWTRYADVVEAEMERASKAVEKTASSFESALVDLPKAIVGAIQGGGDVGKTIGASLGGAFGEDMGKKLADSIGGKLGKALGAAIPGIGALLGSAAGGLLNKVGGFFGGLFGDKEVEKVNDMRDAFFDAQGGFEELQKKLVGVTKQDLVKKIFDAKTVEGFNAAVGEALGMLDVQSQAQEALNDAVKRYGFTVDELGPKFRQQELDKQAAQLLQDFKLLTASGIDNVKVLEKMAPTYNEYIQTALKAGIAIPESMRPALEQMVELGLLTDAAGNKLTDLSGVSFTESLTEGLSRAVDAIERLVAALTGIPPVNIPINVTGGGIPSPEDFPTGQFPHGGTVRFRPGGRVVRVAEWEDEHILSRGKLEGIISRAVAAAAAANGGGTQAGVMEAQRETDRSRRPAPAIYIDARGMRREDLAWSLSRAIKNDEAGVKTRIRRVGRGRD
jgi:hypothetical protein